MEYQEYRRRAEIKNTVGVTVGVTGELFFLLVGIWSNTPIFGVTALLFGAMAYLLLDTKR